MSLAVKYRPKDFVSMVGQTFVKETLQEAVKENKLVGAYLFCGPRGTGKTSTARILAKTINCLNPKDGNPCHECDICKNFMDNKLIDIIEIDAASHTGVDNIRDIIEKAQFLPNKAKYKVYIIDEVHMLSTGAFNALLKILEEPPSFVKFILATTESHKIPETILSRCQRYDFKNISEQDIKERLKYIAKEENIKTDGSAIDFIVKNSHGGLRNAITLFEQFIINDEIKFENITQNLGIIENSFVSDFLNKLINKDISVVKEFDKIIENGKNVRLFFKDLIYTTRDEIIKNIENIAKVKELNNILEILDETYSKTKNSMDEKITLLSGILKVITKGEENINTGIGKTEGNKESLIPPFEKEIRGFLIPNNETITSNNSNNQSLNDSSLLSEGKHITKNKGQIEQIDHTDILDVFGGSEEPKTTQNKDSNFSKEKLIDKIKELGGKGSLTMGLRGGNLSFDGNTLNIKAPTKIALKSIEEASSQEIIITGMENLGFYDIKLKIN